MEESRQKCEVCSEHLVTATSKAQDWISQQCDRCGKFKLSGTVSAIFPSVLDGDSRARLSGWIYDQNIAGNIFAEIHEYNYKAIIDHPIPSVIERSERILVSAAGVAQNISASVNRHLPMFIAASYSKDWQEVYGLMAYLRDQQFIINESNDSFQLSIYGWARVEELSQRNYSDSKQGFVAMWFDESVRSAYVAGIEPAIRDAGFDPLRIDQAEHINRVDDEIIRQIKRSKFIVADFTGHRGGVYFEAGFAMGLDLPVFWTCHEDHKDQLHFDIRQFNCIFWKSPEELRGRLQRRIEAVLL